MKLYPRYVVLREMKVQVGSDIVTLKKGDDIPNLHEFKPISIQALVNHHMIQGVDSDLKIEIPNENMIQDEELKAEELKEEELKKPKSKTRRKTI